MAEQQTVVGFFDNVAEAQQAIQLLLASGFTHETVALSTPIDSSLPTAEGVAKSDSGSGRFYSSLFGKKTDNQLNPAADQRRGTLVTVKAQSADSARQVAQLLDTAGAADVAIDDNG